MTITVEELRQVNAMDHMDCWQELQDVHIPESELSSVDFDAKYCRYSVDEMRAEVIRYRSTKPTQRQ